MMVLTMKLSLFSCIFLLSQCVLNRASLRRTSVAISSLCFSHRIVEHAPMTCASVL